MNSSKEILFITSQQMDLHREKWFLFRMWNRLGHDLFQPLKGRYSELVFEPELQQIQHFIEQGYQLEVRDEHE